MTDAKLLARADVLRSGRTPFVLATVVRAERPTSAKPGDRALLLPDGSMEGFVGGTCAESTVRLQGLRLLETGESTLLRITPSAERETVTEGVVTVGNPCLSGGALDIFLEAMLPPVLVHVYGDTPIGRALVRVGMAVGYEVRMAEPATALPADLGAVVVAAHGRAEEPVLSAALRAGVPYVGLVASRRRGTAVLAHLDVPAELGNRVRTPAGLDIGARTPEEIALSVYAELIAARPRRAAPPEPPPSTGTEATDPVCGMAVAVGDATLSAEHAGRVRYFCGPGCRQAFLADPERYADD